MSKIGVQAQIYLGVVSKIIGETEKERLEFRIEADIPGVIKGVSAFPRRDVLDEPKIGDPVILMSLDPEWNSYYLYWKLKENDFTGFRACGKEFSITPDHILIEVYDKKTWEEPDSRKYEDGEEIVNDRQEMISSIEMKDSGEIKMINKTGTKVIIKEDGNVEVNTAGHNMKVDLGGGTITLTNGTLNLNGGKVGGMPGAFISDPVYKKEGMNFGRTNKVKLG